MFFIFDNRCKCDFLGFWLFCDAQDLKVTQRSFSWAQRYRLFRGAACPQSIFLGTVVPKHMRLLASAKMFCL